MTGAKSVVDVGCGEGLLLRGLMDEECLERIVGLDVDPKQIDIARAIICTSEGSSQRSVELRQVGEFDDHNDLKNVDVVTVLEVVEHIEDVQWIDNAFKLAPKHLVVSTPNREFNALYVPEALGPTGLRHPDHAFEFTRAEFKKWAKETAERNGYIVDLLPIGQATLEHGGTAFMAVFTKR